MKNVVKKNVTVGLNGRGKARVAKRYHERHGTVVSVTNNRAVVMFHGDQKRELPVSYLKVV